MLNYFFDFRQDFIHRVNGSKMRVDIWHFLVLKSVSHNFEELGLGDDNAACIFSGCHGGLILSRIIWVMVSCIKEGCAVVLRKHRKVRIKSAGKTK